MWPLGGSVRRAGVLHAERDIRRIQWWACVCYVITLVVRVPFLDQLFYAEPLISSLGGAGIVWIVGFGVATLQRFAGARRVVRRLRGLGSAEG
jgi:purine-cytosine permease-like protein